MLYSRPDKTSYQLCVANCQCAAGAYCDMSDGSYGFCK